MKQFMLILIICLACSCTTSDPTMSTVVEVLHVEVVCDSVYTYKLQKGAKVTIWTVKNRRYNVGDSPTYIWGHNPF